MHVTLYPSRAQKLEFCQGQRLDFSPIEAAPIQEIGAVLDKG